MGKRKRGGRKRERRWRKNLAHPSSADMRAKGGREEREEKKEKERAASKHRNNKKASDRREHLHEACS